MQWSLNLDTVVIIEIQSNLINSNSFGLQILIRCIESMNDREVDKIIYNHPKMIIIIFFLSSRCFVCIKETSQGHVSFTHTTQNMFLKIVFNIVHKSALVSESIVSEMYLELASILKNQSSNFRAFTVP